MTLVEDSNFRLSRAALESLREGLVAIDRKGTIRLYNAAAAELLGVPAESAIGQTFAAALLELPQADALTDLVLHAIQEGMLYTDQEIAIQTQSGGRQLQVTTSLLREENAANAGIVITLRDVTELRQLSGALEQTNQQLQHAYREADEKNQRLSEALKRVQVMRIGVTVIVLALVGGLGWYSIGINAPSATGSAVASSDGEDATIGLRSVPATIGTISRSLRLSGSLDPQGRVTVVAPVNGRVVQRSARLGEAVQQGQLLIEIRDDAMNGRIRTAGVSALRARARLDELRGWDAGPEVQESRRNVTLADMAVSEQKRAVDEAERLFAKDIVSEQELNSTRAALQRAEISAQSSRQQYEQTQRRASRQAIAEAEAELQNADEELARLRVESTRQQVIAPVSGLLIAPPASGQAAAPAVPAVGDTVTAGTAMLAIGDVSGFAVLLNVDELEVKRVQVGQPARVTVDALDGSSLSGSVESVAGQATLQNGAPTFEVRVAVTQLAEPLRKGVRLGMTATVEIVTALRENVVVLPLEAVAGSPGNQYVWVQDSSAKLRTKRAVTTGVSDSTHVEILGGLKDGEVVLY